MTRAIIVAAVLAVLTVLDASAEPTGSALPGLGPYDEFMAAFLRKWDVPGAGLALARDGRLLLARGYGRANKERNISVEPTSLFRLASLSKTVTAVAVLQLIQAGRVGLDAKVLPILGEIGPRPRRITDPRVHDITVRHLLEHAGGFNRARSGDPVFLPRAVDAARRQRGALPPDCPTILRDTLERTLDFTPGERYAYSNVGYCILGRIIERVTGTPYQTYVRAHVLAPAGAASMQVGRTLEAAPGEVTYYDSEQKMAMAMPGLGLARSPRPYGEFVVETMDSFGGWIGAPVDYLRFLLAIDGRRSTALLDGAIRTQMNTPSWLPEEGAADDEPPARRSAYGLGIRVHQLDGGRANLWHTGSLPGTSTLAVRSADGFAWVVVLNGRPRDRAAFRSELDHGLWTAKAKVKRWPDGDLFR